MTFAIFDLQVTPIPSFESVGLLVQEKKFKIDCQDGGHGSYPGFWIEMTFAPFDLLVTPMSQTKFRVNLFYGLGGVVENVKS